MKCFYCERESTRLCDCIVGLDPNRTCDRPLCPDHAHTESSYVACSRGGKGRGCHMDTVDKCPEHIGVTMAVGESLEANA